MLAWFHRWRLYLALYAVGLGVFGLVAWNRIFHQSIAPHFVWQADAWLQGRAAVEPWLAGTQVQQPPLPGGWGNDWAKVETVALDDGRVVRGRSLASARGFRTLDGEIVPTARVRERRGVTAYMSFPPLPTVLMLPAAALGGRRGNDVLPTLLVAALILPLFFAALRRAAPDRSTADHLWLVAMLAFGTVCFFAAVQGSVWFTAHVVGVVLGALYAWAAIDARRPFIAGLALGLAAVTRPPMAFMFPLFVLEAWRVAGGLDTWRSPGRRDMVRDLGRTALRFAAPIVVIAIAAAAYNMVRFGAPAEFGHSYLEVRQQAQIEAHGLFSYHYLGRNLAVAFTLLPELPGKAPWIQISGHGLAMWVTTPLLLALLWPKTRPPLHRALWITVACVAIPTFFYQNSGWVQFGYRFSLDYLPFLVLLLAVGGRSLGWVARGLILLGIAINLFGAITFDRAWEYYRIGGDAYGVIVRH